MVKIYDPEKVGRNEKDFGYIRIVDDLSNVVNMPVKGVFELKSLVLKRIQ